MKNVKLEKTKEETIEPIQQVVKWTKMGGESENELH